jgi:endonuclease YncB( thermonuclease family)
VGVSLAAETPAGVDMGRFALSPGAVVDGDTIKVEGLDASLRLLALDTEETFKSEADRRAYEVGWEEYLREKKSKTEKPVKVATPTGEAAKEFGKEFFRGALEVRLERDSPRDLRGRFGRFLVYVFVQRNDEWINYNLEVVRAGLSPYFTKYGYSRRFHADFVEAQAEARSAARGIWSPGTEHYEDYERRLVWWTARAETIAGFERDGAGRDDFIMLTHWDAPRRLEAHVGDEVTVLATVGEITRRDHGPSVVDLSRRLFEDFPLVFWDPLLIEECSLDEYAGEYVRVRGVVRRHRFSDGGSQLQMEIVDAGQIQLPDYRPPRGEDEPPSAPDPEATPTVQDTTHED